MTKEQQMQMIRNMRLQGASYAVIAEATGLSRNTVKSLCRRNDIAILDNASTDGNLCKNCGDPLRQHPRSKRKIFAMINAAIPGGTTAAPLQSTNANIVLCARVAAILSTATATNTKNTAGAIAIFRAATGRDCHESRAISAGEGLRRGDCHRRKPSTAGTHHQNGAPQN